MVSAAKKRRDNRPFYVAVGLIALAGAGIVGYLASRPKTMDITTVDPRQLPQAEGYLMGNPSAPVQILEFGDFECPSCSQFAVLTEPDVRKRLVETGIASFRYYDFPLPGHANSWPASHAAACANEQGKFWEMHDQLYNAQDQWASHTTRNPKGLFEGYAKAIGLDVSKWEDCYDSQRHQLKIAANKAEAERRRVGSTPTFVIGKRQIPGALGYDQMKLLVDSALAEAKAAGPVTAPAAVPAADSAATKKGG